MTKKLAVYADKGEIKDLAFRLIKAQPGSAKLAESEALALAQIALAHDLDPYNGEVWYIPKSGIMVGIKGLRKAARKESKAEDGLYWINHVAIKPEKYGAPGNATVYECHLRDTISTKAWAESLKAYIDAGMPYAEAKQALGDAPMVIGVGIATPDEKSHMAIHPRARKRAEADAIKMRYGVEFMGATYTDEDVIEGEFVTNGEITEPEDEGPKRSADEIINELGFDPASPDAPGPATSNDQGKLDL